MPIQKWQRQRCSFSSLSKSVGSKERGVLATRVLYVKTGWMENYCGPFDDDPTYGSSEYLKKYLHGHEAYNFYNVEGWCYGYMPGKKGPDIKRNFGASRDAESKDNILVVWLAPSPSEEAGRGVRIVGWYENATVFNKPQDFNELVLQVNDTPVRYRAIVRSQYAYCIPGEERIGQPHLAAETRPRRTYWYGDEVVNRKVVEYIQRLKAEGLQPIATSGDGIDGNKTPLARSNDPEHRRAVESAAVELAKRYYEKQGYTVTSCESENKGWDLEAINGSKGVRVEVKGLSGSVLAVELTCNEYEKVIKYRDDSDSPYVLFVVTSALISPVEFEFKFDGKRWCDMHIDKDEIEQRAMLNFIEKVSAVGRVL